SPVDACGDLNIRLSERIRLVEDELAGGDEVSKTIADSGNFIKDI
ncbi:unnamed protein product, partial [Rotaria socialis]